MSYNRIAVYGHRGWASSGILKALSNSGAPIRVLYRPGSDVRDIPKNVDAVEVDVNDQPALIEALDQIDIVASLVGHEGVARQHAFIKAIPHTNVKLFVPSDLGNGIDDQGLGLSIPALGAKAGVEDAARKAGIPVTVVQPGCFAESSLRAGLLGVDAEKNRIIFTGGSKDHKLNICSRDYVGAAYAAIFAKTPISEIANRKFGITELQATGVDIAKALEERNGSKPTAFTHSLDQVEGQIRESLDQGSPLAAVWYYRWMWGSNQQFRCIGKEMWDVEGYEKRDLRTLLNSGSYKELPEQVLAGLERTFF